MKNAMSENYGVDAGGSFKDIAANIFSSIQYFAKVNEEIFEQCYRRVIAQRCQTFAVGARSMNAISGSPSILPVGAIHEVAPIFIVIARAASQPAAPLPVAALADRMSAVPINRCYDAASCGVAFASVGVARMG